MGEAVAAFDFDGTLATGDAVWSYIVYRRGAEGCLALALAAAPGMALGWIVGGRGGAKEVLLAAAFGGLTVAEFARQAEDFAHARLLRQLRPAGTAALAAHREAGHRVVIVSASPEPLLRPVAAALQAELVATRLATPGGRVTGRLNGRNCWGPEKLRRLREHIGVPFRLVAAYGDSRGDHELLAAAETAWRRSFPASVTR